MPILGGLHLIIAIGLAIHAMRTGRPYYWLFILLFVPALGSIGDLLDPDREWRRRSEAVALTGSVQAKRDLADECERKGMWEDAIKLYRESAQGMFAEDPAILFGLARAQLGAGDGPGAQATLE